MNSERLKLFQESYKKNLVALQTEKPEYFMSGRSASDIADLFNAKIAAGGIRAINKDGEGIKRTCKELGIKQTYISIEDYLNGENN